MAQLSYTDPLRQRKAVWYTGSDTLQEGEPLCYSFKTTRNWCGYSDSANAIGDTTAEGSHNEGKYMYVESPMRASTTTATWTQATKLLTDNGAEFDNLHVGMFVSVASGTDSDIDGNYEITAQSAANNTITLGNMTDAVAATVTDAISDVTVKIDNISAFAGVVAAGGWCGQAGPRMVEIFVPNGAVVPVRSDQNCVLGRTILAVNSNEQHLTAPLGSYARPVAIAWETVDTATTTGLVLAKLDPNIFLYQKGDNDSLLADDEDTGGMIVNRINVETAKASGAFCALEVRSKTTGGATSNSTSGGGLAAYLRSQVTGTVTSSVVGVGINTTITGGTPTEYITSLHCRLHEDGATMTSANKCTALTLELNVTDDVKAHNLGYMYLEQNGAQAPDNFILSSDLAALPAVVFTGDVSLNGQYGIKVYLSSQAETQQWYIPIVNTLTG